MDLGANQEIGFPKPIDSTKFLLKTPIASWGLGPVEQIAGNEETLRAWRHGVISTVDGRLRAIWGRWWNYQANLCQVWIDQKYRPIPQGECWLHYTFPKGSPGFLTLRYIRSGRCTSIATVYRSLGILEQLAKVHGSHSIVCSSSNTRFTERMFARWGFERHARRLPGYHYIKRLRMDLSSSQ